jgi:hypothetical protein
MLRLHHYELRVFWYVSVRFSPRFEIWSRNDLSFCAEKEHCEMLNMLLELIIVL